MQLVIILSLLLGPLAQSLDPPPLTIQYRVWEEQLSGSTVGRLSDDLRQRGDGVTVEDFRIVEQGQALPFMVEVNDGTVLTVGQLDREELCRSLNVCEILFSVLYRRNGAIDFLGVRVEVLDLNDHSPVFPNAVQEVEISEMATLRMRIPLDRAEDPDAGPNGLQTYSLSTNQHFALDVKTPSAGAKQAELVVIKELDREVQSSFELTLVAWDKGNPPRSGSTLVRINVLDSNDNSPVFEDSAPTIELSEDSAHGTTIINLKATDPDQGANGEIEYSLSKHAPLDVQRLFNIDPQTGTVTLIGALDFEERSSFEIDIQAKDKGPNAIPSHCKLHIKVKDVNDNAPKIHVTWTPPDSPVATVSEGAAEETFLALVMVSDADSGKNGEVHIHIQHGAGHFRLKRIHGDNYKIVTNGTLDREKKMEYSLTLVARDRGAPSLSCTRHLPVHVLDENDNAPIFSQTHYKASVFENNSPGFILQVQAHDVDLELGGKVSYAIREANNLDTPTAFFSIHSSSGAIYTQKSLDYEESHTFSFIVEAIDQGKPPLTSSATVIVDVQDVNDNYPVIEEPMPKRGKASLSIPVNAEKGEIVAELGDKAEDTLSNQLLEYSSEKSNHSVHIRPEGYLASTIKASDPDSGLNGRLHFQIVSGNYAGLFWVDDSTGQLYVNTSNATELIGKTFEFDISVSDMGSPALVTTTTLEVTFINLRDHLKNSSPGQRGQLSYTMMLAICLGATCLLLLLAVALVTTFCRPEKRDNRAYNCRQAESTYTRHPRRPQKQIQKADIQLVPVLRGRREGPLEAEALPLTSASPELEEPFPSEPFHLSPSLSRTVRNQNLAEEHATLPMNQGKTLCKPSAVDLNGTLPRTPATPYRTPRRAKNSESSSTLSPTSTLKRHGSPEVQFQLEDSQHTAPGSPQSCTLRRQKHAGCQGVEDHRQILRNLVRMSMAAFGENNPIELSAASPEVQQVSQLLSLLHQGQLQPRPNFRGNKYSHRTGRSGMQDADWLSTKDSGHGESEAGDVDWDVGRESPIDPLLEEGLPLLTNNTDDVFSDIPDPEWMARLSLPISTDYHENVFVPDGPPPIDSHCTSQDGPMDTTCFSTFGKTPEKGSPLPGTLLSEVSTLFEMLLTQKADAQPRTSAEVLYRLSAAYRRSMGLDVPPGGQGSPARPGEKRSWDCSVPDSQNHHLN